MNPNSIYVDRRLFPKVSELTILDASAIFDSRLRDGEGEHALRLDVYSVAWDGASVFGTDKSHLIGRKLPANKGATRLRHVLGRNAEAFSHIVVDPQMPDVVSLIGPAPVPKEYGPEFKVVPLEDILVSDRFEVLDHTTQAVMAMLKYISIHDPSQVGANLVGLGNGWSVECVTPLGEAPTFFIRKDTERTESEETNHE